MNDAHTLRECYRCHALLGVEFGRTLLAYPDDWVCFGCAPAAPGARCAHQGAEEVQCDLCGRWARAGSLQHDVFGVSRWWQCDRCSGGGG